jgi:hypothetical protein
LVLEHNQRGAKRGEESAERHECGSHFIAGDRGGFVNGGIATPPHFSQR